MSRKGMHVDFGNLEPGDPGYGIALLKHVEELPALIKGIRASRAGFCRDSLRLDIRRLLTFTQGLKTRAKVVDDWFRSGIGGAEAWKARELLDSVVRETERAVLETIVDLDTMRTRAAELIGGNSVNPDLVLECLRDHEADLRSGIKAIERRLRARYRKPLAEELREIVDDIAVFSKVVDWAQQANLEGYEDRAALMEACQNIQALQGQAMASVHLGFLNLNIGEPVTLKGGVQ